MREPGLAAAIWPGSAAQPAPGTITAGSRAWAVFTASRSIARKRVSPTIPKIWPIGIPIWRTRMLSMSSRGASNPSATSRPTVLFPTPGRPTSMTWRLTSPLHRVPERRPAGAEGRYVSVEVPAHLGEGVAAELLQHGVGQHECRQRLGDDAHRRHGRDVGALTLSVGGLARREIDRRQRRHQRADGLHGDADDQRLPSGDPALQTAGVVSAAAEAGARVSGRGRPGARGGVDRVVYLGPRPAGRLDAHPDLDRLHGGDGPSRSGPS